MSRVAMRGAVVTVTLAVLLGGIAVAVASVSGAEAPQRRRGWGRSFGPPPDLPIENVEYNGRFTFSRIMYTPAYWGRGNYMWGLDLYWNHDYPRAERNLMQILESITLMEPTLDGSNIFRTDDPEFMKHPFAYLSEPGPWTMTEAEVVGLRDYLLKGGLLVVDDFEGQAWYNFEEQIRRVLPGARPVILDTTHPLFHAFFDIRPEDILEQYYNYAGEPVIFGIYEDNDPNKRLLVIANYNQDIGESWEFSDAGYIPIELSNNSYKLGVNYVIYSLTH